MKTLTENNELSEIIKIFLYVSRFSIVLFLVRWLYMYNMSRMIPPARFRFLTEISEFPV